jgi:predicted small lipoprotein YifL
MRRTWSWLLLAVVLTLSLTLAGCGLAGPLVRSLDPLRPDTTARVNEKMATTVAPAASAPLVAAVQPATPAVKVNIPTDTDVSTGSTQARKPAFTRRCTRWSILRWSTSRT